MVGPCGLTPVSLPRVRSVEIAEIVESIDRRLTELSSEADRLSHARDALNDSASRSQAAPKQRHGPQVKSPPRYQVLPAGKLVGLLEGANGLSTRQLAKASHGDPAQILALLEEQEQKGTLTRSGSRAATRWHLVTNEDRIASRVAELEKHSGRD